MCRAGSYASVLTPNASVTSAPSAGALTRTLFAPASMCARASFAEVKRPVASSTRSMPSAAHGSFAGSRSASTVIRRPSTTRTSPSTLTGRPSRPAVVSKASSRARTAGSDRSLTATTSRPLSRSSSARSTLRPMRPNPLMAIRVMNGVLSGSPPASRAAAAADSGVIARVRKDHATPRPHPHSTPQRPTTRPTTRPAQVTRPGRRCGGTRWASCPGSAGSAAADSPPSPDPRRRRSAPRPAANTPAVHAPCRHGPA